MNGINGRIKPNINRTEESIGTGSILFPWYSDCLGGTLSVSFTHNCSASFVDASSLDWLDERVVGG